MTIKEKYQQACETPSDINILLPYIREYASQCKHLTEIGVRSVVSTWAMLDTHPEKLICYDIARWPQVDEAEKLALEAGINMEFKLESSLECTLEETDFIMIDSYHTYSQLKIELERHGNKARKFLLFHDTETYKAVGEINYSGIDPSLSCGRGLWPAIEEFLQANPHWKIEFQTPLNNGLTVLKRVN